MTAHDVPDHCHYDTGRRLGGELAGSQIRVHYPLIKAHLLARHSACILLAAAANQEILPSKMGKKNRKGVRNHVRLPAES